MEFVCNATSNSCLVDDKVDIPTFVSQSINQCLAIGLLGLDNVVGGCNHRKILIR